MEKSHRRLNIRKEIEAEASHTKKDSVKGDNLMRTLYATGVDNQDT